MLMFMKPKLMRWAVSALALALALPAHAQETTQDRTSPEVDEAVTNPATGGAAISAGATKEDARPTMPWSRGVPVAQRERARALLLEGNRYLNVPLFAQAAEKYQEALALWPHPAFHFNLALAQLNLVQPVEAYQSFGRAMAHAPHGIAEDKHRLARDYRRRLEQQLGHIEISCEQPGAAVTMDGRPLFTGLGRWQGVVVPGEHQVLGSADGFIPAAERVVVSAGERAELALALQRPVRTVTERYMPAWVPWAGVGLGAAVLGVGAYFDRQASATWDSFDDYVDGRCPVGCTEIEAPELPPRHVRATSDTRLAQGFYIAGSVVLVGSAALLYVNRERVVSRTARERISILPIVTPNGAGISARRGF